MPAAGDSAVAALAQTRAHSLSFEARSAVVCALYRIGTPGALAGVRAALSDTHFRVLVAAARAAGMAKDGEAVDRSSGSNSIFSGQISKTAFRIGELPH